MNVTCSHCGAKLDLPDNKVPKGKDFSFKCFKCKELITIRAERPKTVAKLSGGGGNGEVKPKSPSNPHTADTLICIKDEGIRAKVVAAGKQADWIMDTVGTVELALDRLTYRSFPLMILDDAFDTKGILAAYLNEMEMVLRRQICLVRFHPQVKTGDAMGAMRLSCNYVINAQDLAFSDAVFIEGVLMAARNEHEDFYRVFNESLRTAGRA